MSRLFKIEVLVEVADADEVEAVQDAISLALCPYDPFAHPDKCLRRWNTLSYEVVGEERQEAEQLLNE